MSANVGIPTTYKGIRFRSRVEACWAVFFDRLEWTWDYEPIDLGGYLPDFLVMTETGKQVLFEVKGAVVGIGPLHEHTRKIMDSGWAGEVVVVGALPCCIGGDYYVLGISARPELVGTETEWDWQSCEGFWCVNCGKVSFMTPANSTACRLCGANDGNASAGRSTNLIATAWAEAKNRVQWKA